MTEQEAIYTAMMDTIITFTKVAKTTGKCTAEEIWQERPLLARVKRIRKTRVLWVIEA